ncbi:DUF6507 family protein [Streptomyces sp. NPDC056411]|uniref:DUF6507 family protein n=1 Tax=Streptomyces sp. NPDC056411 TaxID=3345813 RepID=UPI0035D63AB9
MASWDIQPQGVQGQLKVVGRHAEDLGDALNSLLCDMPRRGGAAVPGSQARATSVRAGGAAEGSMVVVADVDRAGRCGAGRVRDASQDGLTVMADRCQAAVLGAAKATNE